jgi:glycosyltransferase involved in cell wall biosynthesis
MNRKINLLIISPIFYPTSGGAATYYTLLSWMLLERGIADRVTIITERVPQAEDSELLYGGQLLVLRSFPHRAGHTRQPLLQYIKYAYQNLQYLGIRGTVSKYDINTVLVHSSFHNFPNLMANVVKKCVSDGNARWIADLRDWLLPQSRFKELGPYHRLIVCSENVMSHIAQSKGLAHKACLIPVIQEPIAAPSSDEVMDFKRRYGLGEYPYISYIGLIKKEKGVDLLLDSFGKIERSFPHIHLVLAGIMKESSSAFRKKLTGARVKYIGELKRRDALIFIAGSRLNINLSPSESLSRSCLEALSLGVQVALPPGIPEFQKHCPENVINSKDPETIATQLERLLTTENMPQYPITAHYPDPVLPQYEEIFSKE